MPWVIDPHLEVVRATRPTGGCCVSGHGFVSIVASERGSRIASTASPSACRPCGHSCSVATAGPKRRHGRPREQQPHGSISEATVGQTLGGTGGLDLEPASDEPPDVFVHDPRAPLRTLGGRGCSTNNSEIVGPRDQRPQESRHDILVAGEITCDLFVAVDGLCGAFVVRLVRVTAQGSGICLTDSVVRILAGSGPRSTGGQTASASNGVVRARISIGNTYVELGAGERLRVEIGGSSHATHTQLERASATPRTHGLRRGDHGPACLSRRTLPLDRGASGASIVHLHDDDGPIGDRPLSAAGCEPLTLSVRRRGGRRLRAEVSKAPGSRQSRFARRRRDLPVPLP